ncbi:Cell division protein FtsZ [Candidatus Xiphinematobacter sp. Idaho Grape]|uniref:cell division protein FtsZ n=1 Tax=Candidatus Xiphinematobacter sp. Idaho Grape TaxID=1704307 RepID=UPI0007068E8B|nr:cell division protein FtsZ [Candidatus Xiphinematobacter sp. Idaho Grape]ALJ56540.1 Cell division protein FtsZ [Candidatus Xiphinematobacter sp. Idaho Grape]
MLEIQKASEAYSGEGIKVKIVGIGNAGIDLVDRFTTGRAAQWETVAINTDFQSLAYSMADSKIPIGTKTTHGLGTGSNPELGREAAIESQAAFQAVGESTTMIIVCAGLGGGTGSGVVPVLLETVRAHGALTVALLTLPFDFEGTRRTRQAMDALEKVRSSTDAILVFENNRMSEVTQSRANIGETFSQSRGFLVQACTTIARLIFGTGPMQTTLGDLAVVLRPNNDSISLFGFGAAEGSNRAHDALSYALENPFMDHGRLLTDVERLLVYIDGPSNLLLSEVQTIVQKVSKSCNDSARILLGIQAAGLSSVPVTVSLLGTCRGTHSILLPKGRPFPSDTAVPPVTPFMSQEVATLSCTTLATTSKDTYPEGKFSSTQTQAFSSSKAGTLEFRPNKEACKHSMKSGRKQFPFNLTTHGRFEKTEPTLVEGEDIDVPTFLRMKIRLK